MAIAILGAGYAGVTVARRLENNLPDDVELVVVDESTDHLVRHELHRVLRRPSFEEDLTVPLTDLLDRADVRQAKVLAVDPDDHTVELEDGTLEYEYAAICLGAETSFYELPGVEDYAIPFRDLEHAHAIRDRYLDLLSYGGRVVVGGAGLTGIQVAGELATVADEEGARESVEIILVEQLDDVAPGFPQNFRAAIRDELMDRGIDIRTEATVQAAREDTIELDDRELPYDLFIWTGGIGGSSALGGTRPQVRGTMQLDRETFVVGDAARVIDRDGELVPASAQSAIREARTAARNIQRLVEYDRDGDVFEPRLDTIEFDPRGWVVSVGDGAVAQVGPTILRGSPALAVKATAGVGYLSSVGAVREAVEVAREEFSGALPRRADQR